MKKISAKQKNQIYSFVTVGLIFIAGILFSFKSGTLGVISHFLVALSIGTITVLMIIKLVKTLNSPAKPYITILWSFGAMISAIIFILFSKSIIYDIPYFISPETVILTNWTTKKISRRYSKYYEIIGIDSSGKQFKFSINKSEFSQNQEYSGKLKIKYLPNSHILMEINK